MGRYRSRNPSAQQTWSSWIETNIPPEPIYAIVVIFLVGLYVFVTSLLPNFTLDLYKYPEHQPFSDFVIKHTPIPDILLTILSLSSLGIFLTLGGMDLFASIFASLTLLFDASISAMTALTPATALQFFFLISAFHCANQVLARPAYSRSWFCYQFISWVFGFASVLFNLETVAVPITLCCQYLTASYILSSTELLKKKSFGRFLRRLGGYLAVNWGLALPFVFGVIWFWRSPYAAEYHYEVATGKVLWKEIVRTPGSFVIIGIVVLAFVIAPFLGTSSLGVVMCPGLFLCILLTLALPFQQRGIGVSMRIVVAKVLLVLLASLRMGSIKNQWYVRGLALVTACVVLFGRIVGIRDFEKEGVPGTIGMRIPAGHTWV